MNLLEELSVHLQGGDVKKVIELTNRAIKANHPPKDILDLGLIAGMSKIGEKFRDHEIFLPDVLLAAKAMYAGMDLLKPLMIKENIATIGRIVIGTVQGDLHDIGKNLVAILLRGAGFEVIDLGNNVSPENFINTAIQKHADVIGMSALLTTTMPVMKTVVDLAKDRHLDRSIKIIVGGAPLSSEYAKEIGADAYCFDGINAVETVKKFTNKT
jgi:5-methyltetrahydrofolate--homocysteine methyltransferase